MGQVARECSVGICIYKYCTHFSCTPITIQQSQTSQYFKKNIEDILVGWSFSQKQSAFLLFGFKVPSQFSPHQLVAYLFFVGEIDKIDPVFFAKRFL